MRFGSDSVVLCVLLVAGCGGPEEVTGTQQCVDSNPALDPFDVGDVEVAAPPPGSSEQPLDAPTVASIVADCRMSGGRGCNAQRLISKDAASCIALLNDFEVGLEPWKVALVYHHGFERLVWNIMSKLQDRGSDGYAGGTLTLDATDGVVLDRGGYRVIP